MPFKTKHAEYVAKAKERLAAQNVKCVGCFAPRNNIIVKPHLENYIWKFSDIQISSDKSLVLVPCMICKNTRELPLSSVSMNYLKQDVLKFDEFMLIKEGKYNRLTGVGDEKVGINDL